MTSTLASLTDYQDWLGALKQRVVSARLRVALAANSELIRFYWDLGAQIAEKQSQRQWGDKLIPQLSADLQKAFPDLRGLSPSNLKYCLRFFLFYGATGALDPFNDPAHTIGQQAVDQVPWGHNILIFTKCSSIEEADFYLRQTLEQGWSRDVLALQLKSRLHERAGKAITNFSRTLPAPQSDLAQQALKDPYTFDFMAMTAPFNERDVEQQLTRHITQFLLELGKGFAFIGRQYHLEIALRDLNKPMGVSEYNLVESLPDNLKGALPTVEEIELDLQRLQEPNIPAGES